MKKILLAMILLPGLLFGGQWKTKFWERNDMSEITRGYIICDTLEDLNALRERTKRQNGWHSRRPGDPPRRPRYTYEFSDGTAHEDTPSDLRYVSRFDTNKGTAEEHLEGITRYTTEQIEVQGFLINRAPIQD